jgi:hypothetical protein
MAPSTLGAFVSLIRRHIGHHFPELQKMGVHSAALGSSDACSHTKEGDNLKQVKVSACRPSRVKHWPLSFLAHDRGAVCSSVSGRVSPPSPLGAVQNLRVEGSTSLTNHQRRLVALIHSFAPICAFSSSDGLLAPSFSGSCANSIREERASLSDNVSRGRNYMWFMNVRPIIGNFDPCPVSFVYSAFGLGHRLCLVQQRTRRPSCHARLVLARRFS